MDKILATVGIVAVACVVILFWLWRGQVAENELLASQIEAMQRQHAAMYGAWDTRESARRAAAEKGTNDEKKLDEISGADLELRQHFDALRRLLNEDGLRPVHPADGTAGGLPAAGAAR